MPAFGQYSTISRKDAVQHAQICLKWEMNWRKERWRFWYWKGFFWVGDQSWSSLSWAAVLRLHYDVCSHKSLCQDCFLGPSNMRMSCLSLSLSIKHCFYWLREPIMAGEMVFWVLGVSDGTTYTFRVLNQCLVKHMFRTAMSPGWASHIVLLKLQILTYVLKEKHKHCMVD